MKNVLRSKIVKFAFGAGLAAQGLVAHADVSDLKNTQAPVAFGSACEFQVDVPEGSLGWIPSGDCKTVYYLPQAEGTVQIPAFSATEETMLCAGLDAYNKDQQKLQEQLVNLMDQQMKASTEKEADFIGKKIALLEGYLQDGKDIYSNKEGAYAQLVFKNISDKTVRDRWVTSNQQLIYQHIALQPATITTSLLTFTSRNTQGLGSTILYSSNIPGLQMQHDGSYQAVVFNGALSGQVVFSVKGACGIMGSKPKTLADVKAAKVDPAAVSSFLIANRSFDVPTRTQMSYIATINQVQALSLLQEYSKVRPDGFKVSEFLRAQNQANLDSLLDLHVTSGVMSADQQANWEKMKVTVQTDVAKQLTDGLASALNKIDALAVRPVVAEDAPHAGIENVATTVRHCSSSSSWFGLSSSSSCGDETVFVPVMRAGVSDLNQYGTQDFHINLTSKMEIDEIYNYSFTTTFSYQKPAPIEE